VADPALGAPHASCPLCALSVHLVSLFADLAAPFGAGDALSTQSEVVSWLLLPWMLRGKEGPIQAFRSSWSLGAG
jgi:hypothetical protein